MSDYLRDLNTRGCKILDDTKTRPTKAAPKPPAITTPPETDPHRAFVKRTIQERPKKAEVVEEIKKFIRQEEEKL